MCEDQGTVCDGLVIICFRTQFLALPNAGTCNYGNVADIHLEELVGLLLTKSSLVQGKWDAGKESVSLRRGICFRILLYNAALMLSYWIDSV